MGATRKALMTRGVDSESATRLAQAGLTLGKLKAMTAPQLLNLGLKNEFISIIFNENRPPIPGDVLEQLLFANRYQCCVCRNANLSIIVHHIDEWAKSRSHDIANLAVLCLHHHDQAHSKKSLSLNLDATSLRSAKQKWEEDVKRFDAESILDAMRMEYSSWNYINELRLFEIARGLKIDCTRIPGFSRALTDGVAQSDGLPAPVSGDKLFYKYEGPNILSRYFYVSEVLNKVIERIPIINVSDHLDKGVIQFALVAGDFIFVQGAHVFSPLTSKKNGVGPGQICKGVRKANKVEVHFTFDRWEATSSSAKTQWLTGTVSQGSLVHIKDLSREDDRIIIKSTAIAICSTNGDLKTRDYAKNLRISHVYHDIFDDDLDEC